MILPEGAEESEEPVAITVVLMLDVVVDVIVTTVVCSDELELMLAIEVLVDEDDTEVLATSLAPHIAELTTAALRIFFM